MSSTVYFSWQNITKFMKHSNIKPTYIYIIYIIIHIHNLCNYIYDYIYKSRMSSSIIFLSFTTQVSFLGGSDDKEFSCKIGDLGSIPGLERSPGERNGNPL